jgi:hypothetical protein
MAKNTTMETATVTPNADLGDTLMIFLKAHKQTWYSSKSILAVTKKEAKLAALKNASVEDVRASLNELVTAKKLKSRKSEKGNWSLYKIATL